MFKNVKFSAILAVLLTTACLQGCAATPPRRAPDRPAAVALYHPRATSPEELLLLRYAPWFEVKDYQHDYNRIGAPAARISAEAPQIYIDTGRPAIYTMVQKFSTGGNDYTNLIYRVHFPEVPEGNLTKGRNVGLLVHVTLNDREEPLLVTTVHTCGCYLAMVPTSNLEPDRCPVGWRKENQDIYGETLPGQLELPETIPGSRLVISLRGETHRVMGLGFREIEPAGRETILELPMDLLPMAALEQIPLDDGYVSFFEKAGWRKGYVRESEKPLERLVMGWWALDPWVGVDKALGPAKQTGTTFYTSLKFWDRQASDLWNFPGFLKYWGWNF
jgi:hypothetical protein